MVGFDPRDFIDVLGSSGVSGSFEEPCVDVFSRLVRTCIVSPSLHDVGTVGVDMRFGGDEDHGGQETRELRGL